jgi:hypothetical protein
VPTQPRPKHVHSISEIRNQNSPWIIIKWNGQNIEHCSHSVYLGVTPDRTLSYKPHVEKTRCKLNQRVNMLNKLAGISWGTYAITLKLLPCLT